jgi:hypothetical protein
MSLFDDFMPGLATTALELMGTPATITRVKREYDPISGNGSTIVEASAIGVMVTPPAPFNMNQVGDSVLNTDLQVFVGAESLLDADLDPTPDDSNGVQIMVSFRNKTYRAINVETIATGELDAMFGLQLRV